MGLSSAAFDPKTFRDAIHFAMVMGSPNQTAAKATFRWVKSQTFKPEDPSRHPYRWNEAVVTDTSRPPVTIDEVAVEYHQARTTSGTDVGDFAPLKAQMTLLDVDYAKVVGADTVDLGGNTWEILVITQEALFSVDVYSLYVERR